MRLLSTATVILLLTLSVSAAWAQDPVQLTCDQAANTVQGDPGTSVLATCPAGCNLGAVWGSGVYSDDSHVCVAAIHAGILTAGAGGNVMLVIQPGQTAYTASTNNGVTSLAWGEWGRSFSVASPVPQTGGAITAECGTNGGSIAGDPGTAVTVTCPAGCGTGAIWGSGVYSDDSSLCSAAIHAGIMTAAGGTFTATVAPGQGSYEATTQNGLTSGSWGEWGRSFTVTPAATATP